MGLQSDCKVCSKPQNNWHACHVCKLEIAYCNEDGGMERAQREMREHILLVHTPTFDGGGGMTGI